VTTAENPFAQLLAVAREVSFIKGAELVRQGEPSRLISHARLRTAGNKAAELEAALHGQMWRAEG